MRLDRRVNNDPATGTCQDCSGGGFAPTRFGRQICTTCKGSGTVARVAPEPAAPAGPTAAHLEAMLDAVDRLADRSCDREVVQRYHDLAEKTRMALDAEMQHLYTPLVETFARIRQLES